MAKSVDIESYLASLTHARADEIRDLAAAILASDPGISARIKWNAPSFCWKGDDRVTMRLQPGDRIELVFHRGATARAVPGFAFDDPTGSIAWAAPDRGVVAIADRADLAHRREALVGRANAWMRATS